MTDFSSSVLTDEQRELFDQLLDEEGLGSSAEETIPRIPRGGDLPLSWAQQRLWFLQRFGSDQGTYNIPGVLRIKGLLDLAALQSAIGRIVDRHEALRTSIEERNGKPSQVIHPANGFEASFVSFEQEAEAEREGLAQEVVRDFSFQPFDLSEAPMMRAMVLRLSAQEHLLLLVMHHIASDGWSLSVFARELGMFYEAFVCGRKLNALDLPVQYADYAAWQRNWLQGDREQRQLEYWRKQLSGAADLELPLARPRPAVRSLDGDRATFEISPRLVAGLEQIAQDYGATLFMVTLTMFQSLLHRYSGQTDIVIGTPIAGRTRSETEGLIGFFVNSLVLRTDFSGNPAFDEALLRVREAALGAYANQDLPFDRLVMDLQPGRQVKKSPLFQVMFVLQSPPSDDWNLHGLDTEWREGVSGREQFDFSLELIPHASGMRGVLSYRTDILEADPVERMAAHLVTLMESACATPRALLADLEMLPAAERAGVVEAFNNSAATYPAGTLHGLVQAQAARTPERVAVIHQGCELTYRQLDTQSNQLACYLRARGVGPDSRVGVCLERNSEIVISLLGVLKSGAAYVPLDPAYPCDRLRYMVDDSAASTIVTQRSVAATLRDTGAELVVLDDDRAAIAALPPDSPEVFVAGSSTAYVIYTSGSTGQPKGVMIEHRSAVTLAHWARGVYDDDELAGMLAATSICFDLSIFEIFLPLCWGGTVIVAKNALELPTLEDRERVRVINTVPSAITELVRLNAVPDCVLTVNLAGEVLKRSLVDSIYATTHARRVVNLYGPSEDTTYSTFVVLERGDTEAEVTIGKPIGNTQAYVLDSRLRPTPIGVPGELYLAGDGLARGYLKRPDLTGERFLPDPFGSHGGRMYRAGDRACWLANGEIRFLGRLDHQVKIRGFRIELGEIEAALRDQPFVAQAVVTAREDEPGQKRLVGYVTLRPEAARPGATALRDALLQRLPEYMVPVVIVELREMPLTANGKLDRERLPAPGAVRVEAQYIAPVNATQEVLACIWAELLGLERIGVRDNFFRAGGHSLLATQIVSRVREMLRIDVPVRNVFEYPTIDEFSRALVQREAKPGQTERIAAILFQVRAMSATQAAAR